MRLRDISSSASEKDAVCDDAGHFLAAAHDVLDVGEQPAPQCPSRMGARKVIGTEAAGIQQGNGQGISQGHGGRGAGGGCKSQRACLLGHFCIQVHIRLASQGGTGLAGNGYELCALALERRDDGHKLGAFPGVGQGDEDVVFGDHADVTVACFGRMHEEGGRAGAGHGGGDLAGHMA
jgi:hypothetical protein